jgi:hypothetical protein
VDGWDHLCIALSFFFCYSEFNHFAAVFGYFII